MSLSKLYENLPHNAPAFLVEQAYAYALENPYKSASILISVFRAANRPWPASSASLAKRHLVPELENLDYKEAAHQIKLGGHRLARSVARFSTDPELVITAISVRSEALFDALANQKARSQVALYMLQGKHLERLATPEPQLLADLKIALHDLVVKALAEKDVSTVQLFLQKRDWVPSLVFSSSENAALRNYALQKLLTELESIPQWDPTSLERYPSVLVGIHSTTIQKDEPTVELLKLLVQKSKDFNPSRLLPLVREFPSWFNQELIKGTNPNLTAAIMLSMSSSEVTFNRTYNLSHPLDLSRLAQDTDLITQVLNSIKNAEVDLAFKGLHRLHTSHKTTTLSYTITKLIEAGASPQLLEALTITELFKNVSEHLNSFLESLDLSDSAWQAFLSLIDDPHHKNTLVKDALALVKVL